MGGVGGREAAGEHARVAAGELAGVQRDRRDLGLRDAHLDAAADQARVQRVVVTVKAQVGLGGHARHEPAVAVGHRRRQAAHQRVLFGEALSDDRARGPVHARVDAITPAVELDLEVERVREPPAGLEVAMQKAVAALQRPLGLAVARVEDHPAQRELPAEREERLGRAAPRRDRALAIPDQLARQRPEPLQAAAHPERDVRELLREHQRAGERARVGQLTRHHVAAAGLTPADRDLTTRLAEVELRQLARTVAGALEAARRRQKPRPQLAQQVVEDRLAAHVAEPLELLADTHTRQPRLLSEQLLDHRYELLELRRSRRPRPIDRRCRRGQSVADRVAMDTSSAMDLALRQALHMLQPPDLRPQLHAKQRLPLVSINRSKPDHRPGRTPPTPTPKWTTFRPAQADQYSSGAYIAGLPLGVQDSHLRGLLEQVRRALKGRRQTSRHARRAPEVIQARQAHRSVGAIPDQDNNWLPAHHKVRSLLIGLVFPSRRAAAGATTALDEQPVRWTVVL